MVTMEIDYSISDPIAKAFIARYKDYRKATAAGDGYEQCRAIGAMSLHSRRLKEEYGYDEDMIQTLVALAQLEMEQKKG